MPMLDSPEVAKYAAYVWKRSRSVESLRVSLYAVRDFLRFAGMGPGELVAKAKAGEVDVAALLNEYIDHLFFERGVSPSTIKNSRVPYVKTFLRKNGVEVPSALLEFPRESREDSDRIPTREELRDFLAALGLKEKAAVLLMCSAGLRVGALSRLKLKHVDFNSDPPKITVPAALNKSRSSYYTFMTPEAAKFLKLYLAEREKRGEKLFPESYLFVTKYGQPYTGRTFEEVLRRELKRHMSLRRLSGLKDPRYDIHIHCFRKFFRTQLEVAGVRRSFREFMMGHRGDALDPSYFRPPEWQVREEYKKAIPFLTILEDLSAEEMRKRQLLDTARLLGFSEDKIRRLEEALARAKSVDEAVEKFRRFMASVETRVISEEDLPAYLADGWDFVATLNSGKVVVRRTF